MYRAWYRKWRPLDFDGVCGQNHVTDILKYQVASKRTSHAYLFCGSRGTGKTSCAKILARAVNCENPQNGNPCNECYACRSVLGGTSTDVIEIDAASNNGVDNVRDIREEVNFTPAELSYRVYIIDEVHMMSASAFNALLKTLEEPPAHVVFILATTELQKLPSTIISRCQRYDFRRLPTSVLVDRMKMIAAAEGAELTDDGALVIARMAQGGMRDAVSLLELCAGARQRIDDRLAVDVLGAGNRDDVIRLVRGIIAKDYEEIYRIIEEVAMSAKDLAYFWQELLDCYRELAVVKTAKQAKAYLDLTDVEFAALQELAESFTTPTLIYHAKLLEEALLTMQRSSSVKRICAEMTLLRLCEPKFSQNTDALQVRVAKLEEEISLLKLGIVPAAKAESGATPAVVQEAPVEVPSVKKEAPPSVKKEEPAAASSSQGAYRFLGCWGEVMEQISEQKGGLSGFLRQSRAYVGQDGSYLLKVSTPFAVTMVKRADTLNMIKNLISAKEGKNISDAPFSVVSEAESKSLDLADELAEILGQ